MTEPESVRTGASEWRAGFPVLLTGIGGIYWMSLVFYPTGVLVKPITEQWGWSRGETTLLVSLNALMILLLGPFAGNFARRVGVYRSAFLGTASLAMALVGVAFSGPNLLLWYAAWIWVGVSQQFCTVIVWSYAITVTFSKRRGLALSLSMLGSAVAASTLPGLTLYLYTILGLRGAYIGLALVMLATMLPLMALTHHTFASAKSSIAATGDSLVNGGDDLTLAQVLRTRRFWAMGLGMLLVAGPPSAAVFHLYSLLTDKGLSRADAAVVLSLMGPALLVGRVGTGWLLDVVSARVVSLCVFPFPIVACIILATYTGSLPLTFAAAICMGLALGAEGDILAYFVSRYFGVRNYASIYAALLGAFSLGAGGFPPIFGFLYDRLGSYDLAFSLSAILMVAGAIILAALGPYPQKPTTEDYL